MGWSPVPKFPLIVKRLRVLGCKKTTPLAMLRRAIIEETGLTKNKSIIEIIKIMEEVGYVKQTTNVNTWKILDRDKNEKIKIDKIVAQNIEAEPVDA